MNRRGALLCLCGITLGSFTKGGFAKTTLSDLPLTTHEEAMRAAIMMALKNPAYPFGAVITNKGTIVGKGVNQTYANPTLHGEISCINDYVAQHGNQNWENLLLYTTGEPCPMCMSALIWSGIGGVIYGSSIETIKRSGIKQFTITAQEVNQASNFSKTQLMGGVLEAECDALFANRKRS